MISMESESLHFLLNNPYGFDTLTVNGCFEERSKYGFTLSAKTLAIENLNTLGISISLKLIFNHKVVSFFLSKLKNVSRQLER